MGLVTTFGSRERRDSKIERLRLLQLDGVSTVGKVEWVHRHEDRFSISYTYRVDGTERRQHDGCSKSTFMAFAVGQPTQYVGISQFRYSLGEPIQIRYLPSDPSSAHHDPDFELGRLVGNRVIFIVILGLGAAMLAGALIWRIARPPAYEFWGPSDCGD